MGYALESKTEFERLEYQSTFPKYDYRRELAGLSRVPEGSTILDAGCGSGVVARFLATENPKSNVIGCDFSQDRVTLAMEAAKKISNIRFEQQDLSQLTFKNETFDFIVCRYVLQHVLPGKRERAVEELRRCLKPGGTLVMIDFDGTLYNLYPQSEFVRSTLNTLEESDWVDLRIGRKLPSYLVEAGFSSVDWKIETIECRNETMDQEIELMESRLKNTEVFFTELLKNETQALRFVKEYLSGMKDPRAVLYYNKFIVTGKKPITHLKSVKPSTAK